VSARAWVSGLLIAAAAQSALAQPSTPEAPVAPERIVVLEIETSGIDPIVARFAERALKQQARALGYEALGLEHGRRALSERNAGSPPSLADLWRATDACSARFGVRARVSASAGRYQIELLLASREGLGPFEAKVTSGAEDLESQIAAALAELLSRAREGAPVSPAPATAPPSVIAEPSATPVPAAAPTPAPAPQPEAKKSVQFFGAAETELPPEPPRLRLALHNDVAIGMAQGGFWNDVLGARVDYRFGDSFWVGPQLGYANLEGREGRASSLLVHLQAEQRVPLASWLALPVRMGLGYLLRNGAFLRLSSGLAFAIAEHTWLGFDLLAPTFWATPSRTLFSLDFAAELSVEL
jgi:hypothetical protein